MKTIKESKFKGALSRCEVESIVNPLRDKEPTKQWLQELKEVLGHFDVQKHKMCQLTADSNKCNLLGHRYSSRCFPQIIDNFISGKGSRTWTANAQKTVNDHLDILVDYLSKPIDPFEAAAETLNDTIVKASESISKTQTTSIKDNLESSTMSLRERLEKERAEGKWPSVDERIKEQENNLVKAPENLYVIDKDNQAEASKSDGGSHLHYIYDGGVSKLVDSVGTPHKIHVKRIKKHKKHKSNNIYITIKIGR